MQESNNVFDGAVVDEQAKQPVIFVELVVGEQHSFAGEDFHDVAVGDVDQNRDDVVGKGFSVYACVITDLRMVVRLLRKRVLLKRVQRGKGWILCSFSFFGNVGNFFLYIAVISEDVMIAENGWICRISVFGCGAGKGEGIIVVAYLESMKVYL